MTDTSTCTCPPNCGDQPSMCATMKVFACEMLFTTVLVNTEYLSQNSDAKPPKWNENVHWFNITHTCWCGRCGNYLCMLCVTGKKAKEPSRCSYLLPSVRTVDDLAACLLRVSDGGLLFLEKINASSFREGGSAEHHPLAASIQPPIAGIGCVRNRNAVTVGKHLLGTCSSCLSAAFWLTTAICQHASAVCYEAPKGTWWKKFENFSDTFTRDCT